MDHRDYEYGTIKSKKARIAVEILGQQQHAPKHKKSVNPKTSNRVPPPASRPTPAVLPTTANDTATTIPRADSGVDNTKPPAPSSNNDDDKNLTKHQAKVANGIKHELDRLQPQGTVGKGQGGRKLRSQDATRFKSELSAYFPDYDEVIGNDPKEECKFSKELFAQTTDASPVAAN